ncbi:MAG: CoA transferase, partial [Erythrobacter sp.]|nr:CoA transferase [Erythrobacter sp.]
LIAFLRETFATRTRAEWEAWFADKDVAFAPVLDFREALDAPHVAERGLLVTDAGGGTHIAPAIRFAGEEWTPGPVPELGDGGA